MSLKNDPLRENLLQHLETVQEGPQNTWLNHMVGLSGRKAPVWE